MKQTNMRFLTIGVTIGAAILGFLCRIWQRQSALDEQGLWMVGSTSVLALLALSGLSILVLALLCSRLGHRPGWSENFSGGLSAAWGYLLGGLLLVAANLVGLLQQTGVHRFICLFGIVAGGVVFAHGLMRSQQKRPGLLAGCVVVIWLVVRVIVDFKSWSTDPAVLDYCFQLLALLCSMLGCFQTAGFSAEVGKRRMSAFWSCMGVYFCGISLADGGLLSCLTYGGFLLILLQNSWCLLQADPKTE